MRISIVTPNYNGATYLAAAMDSVLEQRDANVEYVVVDGGSTDDSVEIISERQDRLAWWTSEGDAGMYDALNKGFEKTSGEVMAWLNSDDMYTPWALSIVAEIFESFPEVEWITTLYPLYWDTKGRAARSSRERGFTREGFQRGHYLPGYGAFARGWIQQESTFWRRSLWDRAGGKLDPSFKLAGDVELWARFFALTDLVGVAAPLGGFRVSPGQATGAGMDEYMREASAVLGRHGIKRRKGAIAFADRLSSAVAPLTQRLGVGTQPTVLEYDMRAGRWIKRGG